MNMEDTLTAGQKDGKTSQVLGRKSTHLFYDMESMGREDTGHGIHALKPPSKLKGQALQSSNITEGKHERNHLTCGSYRLWSTQPQSKNTVCLSSLKRDRSTNFYSSTLPLVTVGLRLPSL